MARYDHAWETLRPVVEILLIAQFALFLAVITPLVAAVPPPMQAFKAGLVIAEGDNAYVVEMPAVDARSAYCGAKRCG